jgi:GNAT superfamily N-acetyltransferase
MKESAIEVWRSAWAAQSAEPSADRIRRVRGKVSDPRAFLVVLDRGAAPAGMALVEPYRSANGFGTVQPDRGHISMVYVHPELQGSGVGTELLERVIAQAPWSSLSLWTQRSTSTLRRLGFRATPEKRVTGTGVRTQRWERAGV